MPDPQKKTPEQILDELSEPFPPEAIRFRPQGETRNKQPGAEIPVVAYIDKRTVARRLNKVLGPHNWENRLTPTAGGYLCKLSIRFPDVGWVSREDVGAKSKQPGEGDKDKAAASDAIKRAAVLFGVGAYLYRLPRMKAVWDGYQIKNPPALPQWALPVGYRHAGPEAVADLSKLIHTYASEAQVNESTYTAELLQSYGYSKDIPLSRVRRQDVAPMLQRVNSALVELAKMKSDTKPDPVLPADYPQSGTDLLRRLQQFDAACAESGICLAGAIVAHVYQAGGEHHYSPDMSLWTGAQIANAVRWAQEKKDALVASRAKKTGKPAKRADGNGAAA